MASLLNEILTYYSFFFGVSEWDLLLNVTCNDNIVIYVPGPHEKLLFDRSENILYH